MDVPGRIDESIAPNETLWLQYIDRNPVHRCIQVAADNSLHEINTFRAEYLSQGMNHFEGGWPKDINPAENDQTMRFRKKIEKDDAYINSVLGLCQVILPIFFSRYTSWFKSSNQAEKAYSPRPRVSQTFSQFSRFPDFFQVS